VWGTLPPRGTVAGFRVPPACWIACVEVAERRDRVDAVPGPDPVAVGRLGRRTVLRSGVAGVWVMALPPAGAAASEDALGDGSALAVPSGLDARPIGYASPGDTGAIRVTWVAVAGATSYELGWTTDPSGAGPLTLVDVGDVTTFDLTGRVGNDTDHRIELRALAADRSSLASPQVVSSSVIATGGTVTTFVGDGTSSDGTLTNAAATYVVHTFTTSATFALNRAVEAGTDLAAVECLVVGGGGAGGSRHGGGGGAGGLVIRRLEAVTAADHAISVGGGGIGAAAPALPGDGEDSEAFGLVGAGGGHGSGASRYAASSGGSGGGASYGEAPGGPSGAAGLQPGSVSEGFGNAGGAGFGTAAVAGAAGGGGGGALTAGGDGGAGSAGGGGAGRTTVISGNSPVSYAGGGGGSASGVPGGAGGDGGGGAGVNNNLTNGGAGFAGAANTGGGGGAGGFDGEVNHPGGDGGSGIVIVRYRLPVAAV
jgi:hypothetical protein